MLIEAVGQPIRYRFRDGREILLPLGKPVELPDQQAWWLLSKAPTKVRRVETLSPTVNQRVCWEGVEGATRSGVVDFLHTEPNGTRWAFVSLSDGGWAALNLKYARVIA